MPLSAADVLRLRKYVGTEIEVEELDGLFDVYGSLTDVALHVLSERRADILAGAAKYDIDGVYSEDNKANLEGLELAIAELGAAGIDTPAGDDEDGSGIKSARLVRPGLLRR